MVTEWGVGGWKAAGLFVERAVWEPHLEGEMCEGCEVLMTCSVSGRSHKVRQEESQEIIIRVKTCIEDTAQPHNYGHGMTLGQLPWKVHLLHTILCTWEQLKGKFPKLTQSTGYGLEKILVAFWKFGWR